jgi:hypothetical protein
MEKKTIFKQTNDIYIDVRGKGFFLLCHPCPCKGANGHWPQPPTLNPIL